MYSQSPKRNLNKSPRKTPKKDLKRNSISPKSYIKDRILKNTCSNCLLSDMFYFNFSCKHRLCENCFWLAILCSLEAGKLTDEDLTIRTDNSEFKQQSQVNNAKSINCYICNQGTTQVLLNEFIIKKISKSKKSPQAIKCEGCDVDETNKQSTLIPHSTIQCDVNYDVVYCINCKLNMCNLCEERHNKIKAFKNHLISTTMSSSTAPQNCKCCLENKLVFKCKTCEMKVCSECCILYHLDHDFYYCLSKEDFDESMLDTKSRISKLSSGNLAKKPNTSNSNNNNIVNNPSLGNIRRFKKSNTINPTQNINNGSALASPQSTYRESSQTPCESSLPSKKRNSFALTPTNGYKLKKLDANKSKIRNSTINNINLKGILSTNNDILNTSNSNSNYLSNSKRKNKGVKNSFSFLNNLSFKLNFNSANSKRNSTQNQAEMLKIKNKSKKLMNELKLKLGLEVREDLYNNDISTINEEENVKHDTGDLPVNSKINISDSKNKATSKISEKRDSKNFKINLDKVEKTDVNKDSISTVAVESYRKFNSEETVQPLYKTEKEFGEKIKKNFNSFKILVDLIKAILNDCDSIFEKRSYTETDKAVTHLKDLKSYLKKLKTHIDNNKNFSIIQIMILEKDLYEAIKNCINKEKMLNLLVIRELALDLDLIARDVLLKNSLRDDKVTKTITNKELNEISDSKIDLKNLTSSEFLKSNEISTFSFPHIMCTIYTLDKRFFMFYINNISNYIEVIETFFEDVVVNKEVADEDTNDNENNDNLLLDKENSSRIKNEKTKRHILKGHKGQINSLRSFVKLHKEKYFAISCSSEGCCKIWNVLYSKIELIKSFEFPGVNIFNGLFHFIPDDSYYQSQIKITLKRHSIFKKATCNLSQTKDTRKHSKLNDIPQDSKIKTNEVGIISALLITSAFKREHPLQIFDPNNGELLKELSLNKGCCFYMEILDVSKGVSSMKSNNNTRFLLCASVLVKKCYDMIFYNFDNHQLLFTIKTENYINSVHYKEEAEKLGKLIMNDRNGNVIIVDFETGSIINKISGYGYYCLLKFDNQYFLSSGKLNYLQIVDIDTLQPVKTYQEEHKKSIRQIELSPFPGKGLCVFTYGEDKVIKIWNSSTEKFHEKEELLASID